MKNNLISVIIPIFNMEKYLKRCLDSVINQSYKNLEIILVDDGSTDSSSIICDEYEKKDIRIKVFHKKNGGLSDAKNFGIKKATGKYITFVDSDDWIDLHMYEELLNNIIKYNADISICGRYIEFENGKSIEWKHDKFLEMSNVDSLIYLNSFHNFDMASWDKLYNRKLFKNISFPYGKKCEDAYTTYLLFAKSKKVIYVPKSYYHYFQRTGSISRNCALNLDYIYAAQSQMNYFKDNFKDIVFSGVTNYVFSVKAIFQYSVEKNISLNSEMIKYINDVKKYVSVVLSNKYIGIKKKITFLLFIYFNKLYKFLLKLKYFFGRR